MSGKSIIRNEFQVNSYSKKYEENYERIFKKKKNDKNASTNDRKINGHKSKNNL